MTLFRDFVSQLVQRHGPDAERVRHELFFQAQKPAPTVRAWAAWARDSLMLRQPAQTSPQHHDHPIALLVASLGGANGWLCLERALPTLAEAGLSPVILAHPRLPASLFPRDIPVVRPGGASLLFPDGAGAVATTLCRHHLWRNAVSHAVHGLKGLMLMHNDFDMMNSAASSLGWPSICLQHGIPTDEFFPCRADYQLVWGVSSARAYTDAGCLAERVVIDPLGRDQPHAPLAMDAPIGLAVVSQRHATIFGPQLPQALTAFVHELADHDPALLVMLHPQERDASGYGSVRYSRPPHSALDQQSPSLVLAWCSTMSIDAALRGHWVATLDLPVAGNEHARLVASPPLRVGSAHEAVALLRRLQQDSAFRSEAARQHRDWLTATVSSQHRDLAPLLHKMTSLCPSS